MSCLGFNECCSHVRVLSIVFRKYWGLLRDFDHRLSLWSWIFVSGPVALSLEGKIYPRLPNTSSEAVLDVFWGSKYLLRRFGCLGKGGVCNGFCVANLSFVCGGICACWVILDWENISKFLFEPFFAQELSFGDVSEWRIFSPNVPKQSTLDVGKRRWFGGAVKWSEVMTSMRGWNIVRIILKL